MATSGKEERMWRLADELAASGDYNGWLAVEQELRRRGYPRARQLLDDEYVRSRISDACKAAQAAKSEQDSN